GANNNMAFHLKGLDTPEMVENQFAHLISEVDGCLAELLSFNETPIRNQVISTFLNHINDSHNGCMEVRLRNALTFYGMYKSTGIFSLNHLMEDFYQNAHSNFTVSELLEY